MPRRDLIVSHTLALACLTCLAACGAPPTMQTTPLEHAITALPPTMPSPPAHRGALELSIAGEAQSILRTAERSPPDLSHYVRPASGEIAIGGRFSRFVGARLIGELGLPSPPTDAHQRNLLGAGLPGRLGGAVVLGYTSEASVVHATLSLEGGLHVIGIQRLLLVETRTCPFDGFGFGPCTPWSFAGLAGTTGLDLLPYVRVTAVLGVVVTELRARLRLRHRARRRGLARSDVVDPHRRLVERRRAPLWASRRPRDARGDPRRSGQRGA